MPAPPPACRVRDIIDLMERIAPARLAESWDNCGLQLGAADWPVRSVWVALDPLPEVVTAACAAGADMLITHHPLFMRAIKRLDLGSPGGRVVARAIGHRLAIFAAHTNFDSAAEGLNDILARRLEIDAAGALQPPADDVMPGEGRFSGVGLGRIGDLRAPTTLAELARRISATLALPGLRIAGPEQLDVSRVALCTGSGGRLVSAFLATTAQVYISGDLRYHDARDVVAAGRGLIDIGHFASEHLMVQALADRLEKSLAAHGVAVTACSVETDPLVWVTAD